MANFKISNLPDLNIGDESTYIIVAKDGRNYRMSIQQLINNIDIAEISEVYTESDANDKFTEIFS